ncbi:DUF4352 domain-containing protein [Neobacillus drentensis]|uniref:DUF4352 domain-containing protein n=1 Tax=Neobacillus drentensis TaxID=220684 RepID=UPI000823FC58|nr:DUF4352 domain-containing protein [Neobacillus drentensis]
MLDNIGAILSLVTFVLLILAFVGLIKRNGTAKKRFKWTGISFLLTVVLAIISIIVSPEDQTASKKVDSQVASSSSSEDKQVDKDKEAEAKPDAEVKKKAEEKAKADADSKKKAEEKAKADAATKKAEEKKKADAAKKATYKVGNKFKVGDFEYVITSIKEDRVIKSDNQFIKNKETQGKFAIIDFTVMNLDKEARMVDSSLFLIKDSKDREYEPMVDGDIMMLLGDSNLFLEDVNPGLSRKGKIVFELPTDVKSYSLEVSSGVGWSGGKYKTIKLK